MLGSRELVVDTFSEISDLIQPCIDAEFWNFQEHALIPGAIYVIGRRQMFLNADRVRTLVNNGTINVVFSNPAEGSDTLRTHTQLYGIDDLVQAGRIPIIGGGDMDSSWPCLQYDSFLPKVLDYDENHRAIAEYASRQSNTRPYKFLFLNGRARKHRTYLLQELSPLLDQAIWTNLDSATGPVRTLDPHYEYTAYQHNVIASREGFVKHQLFNDEWGEIYLASAPYLDTYFSLVTETVFDYPYSFRTEKIWKPIAIGHPFVVAANAGYYRDLHRLGFRTFGHVIDESFDSIDNNLDRQARIATIVKDLCQQDLASFLDECYNVCKYNQQHLADMRQQVRAEFPQRFEQFINERFRI
jgi:hypothetical protein